MPFFPDSLNGFLDRGGPVLFIIMAAAFVMWALILERFFYFRLSHKDVVENARSTNGTAVRITLLNMRTGSRDKIVSEVRQQAQANVILLKAVVALAPMLGLLGTVTGMVNVFDLMAITGSSDARAMSAGVSRATIPTMAGMVISISGLLFTMGLDQKVRREVAKVEDQMEIHKDA